MRLLVLTAFLSLAGCGDKREVRERHEDAAAALPARAPRPPVVATVEALVTGWDSRPFAAIGDEARARGLGVAALGGLDDDALPGMLEAGDILDGGDGRIAMFDRVAGEGVHLVERSGPLVMDLAAFRREFAGRHAWLIAASEADMDARWARLFPRSTPSR